MKKLGVSISILLWTAVLVRFGQAQPYCFMLLADTQFGMYASDKGFAQETENFEFAVAAANRLKPGFVIILGDLVNRTGDTVQIREYKRISAKIDASIPMYHVAGNHDVGNDPAPESLSAYRREFGRDYYSFRAGPVYGIVLNSALIHSPLKAAAQYHEQDAWFRQELEKAKAVAPRQVILFLHHPLFLSRADEPDQYENLPFERRRPLLDLLNQYGIRQVFAGHTHKNVIAQNPTIQVVATGAVGKPLGQDGSGIRLAALTDAGVEHRYYDFGRLPEAMDFLRK